MEIKRVAIYLRKSRDETDTDDVLIKHRETLIGIARKNNWKYDLYEEIVSGEHLAARPEMLKLLNHINEYDGVLVMDIDRLGRGDTRERGIILDALNNADNNTLVITPAKIYDLSEENDQLMMDFQSLFANLEYKQIKKRMAQGKVAGAKLGNWTNGSPPYPYYYDSRFRQVCINDEKAQIYRLIVKKYLEGESTRNIMVYLNTNKIPTPTNVIPEGQKKGWSQNVITRLLTSQVHLGHVVYNKTKSKISKDLKKHVSSLPQSEWIVSNVKNHTPLKSEEEHQRIIEIMNERSKIPKKARAGTHTLSGLLKCGRCGYSMSFKLSNNNKSGEYVTICGHKFKDGSKCPQVGIKLDQKFYDTLFAEIVSIDADKLTELRNGEKKKEENAILLNSKLSELERIKGKISKLLDLYEDSQIDKQEFISRKQKREAEKGKLEIEIKRLESLNVRNPVTEAMIHQRIEEFTHRWYDALDTKQKNEALHSLIEKIIYDRNKDNVITLGIKYH